MLSPLCWSQSYPTQRIENGDTVVVMTKKQADQINEVFRRNSVDLKTLSAEVEEKTRKMDSVIVEHTYYVREVHQATDKIMKHTMKYDRKMRGQEIVLYAFMGIYMYLLLGL